MSDTKAWARDNDVSQDFTWMDRLKNVNEILSPYEQMDKDEEDRRMDNVIRNGNSGEHYDVVQKPKHYDTGFNIEVIEIIARTMTKEQFKGYCLGNYMKYKMRAGDKGELNEDLDKAKKYQELYEQYKTLCFYPEPF